MSVWNLCITLIAKTLNRGYTFSIEIDYLFLFYWGQTVILPAKFFVNISIYLVVRLVFVCFSHICHHTVVFWSQCCIRWWFQGLNDLFSLTLLQNRLHDTLYFWINTKWALHQLDFFLAKIHKIFHLLHWVNLNLYLRPIISLKPPFRNIKIRPIPHGSFIRVLHFLGIG